MQILRGHTLSSLTTWEKGMVSVGRRELRDPILRCLLDMQLEMLHGIEYISLEFRGGVLAGARNLGIIRAPIRGAHKCI